MFPGQDETRIRWRSCEEGCSTSSTCPPTSMVYYMSNSVEEVYVHKLTKAKLDEIALGAASAYGGLYVVTVLMLKNWKL